MNKKIKYILLLAIVLIIGLGFFSIDTKDKDKLQAQENNPQRIIAASFPSGSTKEINSEIKRQATHPLSKPTTEKQKTISAFDIKRVNEDYPLKEKVAEDIKKNPHTPSRRLMNFAKTISPLMDKAYKNEADADLMLKELSNCAHNETVATSARAMCVTYSERLADIFPKFEKNAEELRASMSPEVQKILDTNDSVIRK